jgi:hypothetical protein
MNKAITFLLTFLLLAAIGSAQTGINWMMGMNIASSATGNAHPRITVDRSGNPLVLWNHSMDAMFSRWNGTAFTAPVPLNPQGIDIAGAAWMGPDIASHGDTVYVVFKQIPEASDTCHIFCVHSYDGGMTFSTPVRIDYIADSISRFPTVATDEIGNPVVAFMKFDNTFMDARWVVTRSTDFGNTFSVDVKASGWSSAASTVCDCCPGAVVSSGSTVAMLYRDNNNNIRDTWAGISTDTGAVFSGGMPIDQHNWSVFTCPATGPDGVIIGDTLYAVFMNGIGGTSLAYMSASSVSTMTGMQGVELTDGITGLSMQSYPRIASDGTAMAVVWKQVVNGGDECMLRFTNDISNGLPAAYDTVDLGNVVNADVAISNGNVYVVWQDGGSGTVKFRNGTFNSTTGIPMPGAEHSFSVFPNPASAAVIIRSTHAMDEIRITNVYGQTVFHSASPAKEIQLNLADAGIYFVTAVSNDHPSTKILTVLR